MTATGCQLNNFRISRNFTTGGLPPISLSWHQGSWGSRPAFFFAQTLTVLVLVPRHGLHRKHRFQQLFCCVHICCCHTCLFSSYLAADSFFWLHYSGFQPLHVTIYWAHSTFSLCILLWHDTLEQHFLQRKRLDCTTESLLMRKLVHPFLQWLFLNMQFEVKLWLTSM
jgi:hypothetical protein